MHLPFSLLTFAFLPLSLSLSSCYWRSNGGVTQEDETSDWYPCNNTQLTTGGAQLCCLYGAQCGEDSICHSSDGTDGWFVGGCTDPTYADPVCRTSCTGDAQTWITYDDSEGLWRCCGDNGLADCADNPSSETFQAISPSSWTAVPSLAMSTPSTSRPTTTVTTTATASDNEGTSLSSGAKAGIGVAAAAAGVAIVAAVIFFVLWRKAKSAAVQNQLPAYRRGEENVRYRYQERKEHAELSDPDAQIRELPSDRM